MKLVHFLVLLAIAACAFPAGAVAQGFEVDTLADTQGGGCVYECSLREAIEGSNETMEGPDTITFGVGAEGVIEPQTPLPELEDEVEIDATTAPGWKGEPVVELDGTETFTEGGETWGLQSAINSKVRIEGLAIGGFYVGLWIGSEHSAEVCGNRIGTNLAGTAANPNWIGVAITSYAEGVRLGRACPEGVGGNQISGNSEWGVVADGGEVEIDQNLVGTDESGGAPLPNGPESVEFQGGGILIEEHAIELTVGGIDDLTLPHNVIAFNRGPGVVVESGATFATIRQNSIHSNQGLGIESPASTVGAEIAGVAEIVNGTTTVTGTVQGLPNRAYDLEFFSSEACDPSGFGEGRFFLASTGDEVETDASGSADFSATLLGLVLPASHFFTLTATDGPKTSTSEFSNCVSAPTPEGEDKQQTPPPPPPPPLPPPTPVNGKSVTVVPKSGRVLIKLPGSNKFVPLGELKSIPVGSIVDATNGRVTLTSVDANGVEQSADFYEGRFQVLQSAGSALVTLRLRGGDFSSCSKAGSSARASKRSGRKLWGSGAGRFRSQGNFGAASVRGTIWLTVDQCKGTFFKVRRGVVTVSDFVADKTLSLSPGQSYWAKKLPG